MNKFVRIIKGSEYSDYTPQDLIHADKNRFKNWSCSAGVEGIFIDWSGDVWPATCSTGNTKYKLGSVNDASEIKILQEYINCDYEYCPCLIEIYLPKYKVKPQHTLQEGNVLLENFHAIDRASKFDRDRKYIMWAFGRKCNFSCSYCDDVSHSKDDKDLVSQEAIDKMLQYAKLYRNGKPIMWSFTGGEPTINPRFLDFVKTLKEEGDIITVATNGSQGGEYYSELSKYANINISVHFEFLKPEKLRKVAEKILERTPDWFGLNFMIMPGKAELCLQYIEMLKTISNFKKNTNLHFDILRVKNTSHYEFYSDEDKRIINLLQSGDF